MGEAGDGSLPFLINFDQQYLAFVESGEKLNLSSVNEKAFALLAPRNMKYGPVIEDPKTHYLKKLQDVWSTFGEAHKQLLLQNGKIKRESEEFQRIYNNLFYADMHDDRLPEIQANPAMSVMLRDMTGLARLYGAMVYNMGDFVGPEHPCLTQLSYVNQVDLAEICYYGFSYNLVDDLSPKNSYKTLQIVYMKTYARSAMQEHHERARLSKEHVKELVKKVIQEDKEKKEFKKKEDIKKRFALEIAHSNNARINDLEMQISSTFKKFEKMFEFLPSELQVIVKHDVAHAAYKQHAKKYMDAYKFVKDMQSLGASVPTIEKIPDKVKGYANPTEIIRICSSADVARKKTHLKSITSYLDNAISEDVRKLRKDIFGLDPIRGYIKNVMSLYIEACEYRRSHSSETSPDILLKLFDMFQHTNALLQDTVTTLDTIKYMYTETRNDFATILNILKDGHPLTSNLVDETFEKISIRAAQVLKEGLQPYEMIHNRVEESERLEEEIRKMEEEWTKLDQAKERDVIREMRRRGGGVFIKSDKVLRNDALKVQKPLYTRGRQLFVKYRRTYISVHDYQIIKKSRQWNVVTRS
jgi:hypothetical protein